MHPITVIEIIASTVFAIILFVIPLLMPSRWRKKGFYTAASMTLLLLLLFAVRPFWNEYRVSIKKEYLNQYLEKYYPNQKWEISKREGRQYNIHHLEVRFENEKDWIYSYSVSSRKKICQSVWSPPEGKVPDEGRHYEGGCE